MEVLGWLEVEVDRERFGERGQAAFELGLRRDGVVVDVAAPNYLFCFITATESGGIVSYAWDLAYYRFELDDVHTLLWTTGGIVSVGVNNFSAESFVDLCVDGFANEWLKQNPAR